MYQDGEEGLVALIGLRLVDIGTAAYQESPFHLYETRGIQHTCNMQNL